MFKEIVQCVPILLGFGWILRRDRPHLRGLPAGTPSFDLPEEGACTEVPGPSANAFKDKKCPFWALFVPRTGRHRPPQTPCDGLPTVKPIHFVSTSLYKTFLEGSQNSTIDNPMCSKKVKQLPHIWVLPVMVDNVLFYFLWNSGSSKCSFEPSPCTFFFMNASAHKLHSCLETALMFGIGAQQCHKNIA